MAAVHDGGEVSIVDGANRSAAQRPTGEGWVVQFAQHALQEASVLIAVRHGTIELEEVADAGIEERAVGGIGSMLLTRPAAT